MGNSMDLNQEITTALRNFCDAYEKKDLNAVFATLAPSHQIIMIGSGKDELYFSLEDVRKACKRDWSQADEVKIDFKDLKAGIHGDVAWAYCNSLFSINAAGETANYNFLWSTVFVKHEGNWLMVQSHLSIPAGDQSEGSSWPGK